MTRGIEGSKKDIANAGLQQQVRNRRIEFSPSNRCGEGGGCPTLIQAHASYQSKMQDAGRSGHSTQTSILYSTVIVIPSYSEITIQRSVHIRVGYFVSLLNIFFL